MIAAVVLIAELLCALWFVLFITMVTSMHREARIMPGAFLDEAGRLLSGSVRVAFTLGLFVLVAVTLWQWLPHVLGVL